MAGAWIFSQSIFASAKNEVFVPKKIILTDCSEYLQIVYRMHGDSFIGAFAERTWKKEAQYSVLDRLAIVGKSGMGALTYHPQKEIGMGQQMDDLDELSVHCQKILSTQYSEKLDELYRLGGTSGGARP